MIVSIDAIAKKLSVDGKMAELWITYNNDECIWMIGYLIRAENEWYKFSDGDYCAIGKDLTHAIKAMHDKLCKDGIMPND